MKNLYFTNFRLTSFWCFVILFFAFFSNPLGVNAQVKPFTQRTSSETPTKKIYNIKGDFTLIGNTNLTLQSYSDTGDNAGSMRFVDVDSDSNTLNSSSARLTLSTENGAVPSCSKIIYAGLYWTGRSATNNTPFNVTKNGVTKTLDKTKILLKGPSSSSYTQITANTANINYPTNGTNNDIFVAYTEVTDYVRTNGIGDYFAANIALREGTDSPQGFSGGWGMIVIYENSQMKNRDITIFDGYAHINSNEAAKVLPITGFNSVATGNVGMKLGLIASEGDVSYNGDYFEIQNKTTNTYTRLNNEANVTNNFFNSAIQTGGNVRNPNVKNNTGIDIKMFNIPNTNNVIIGNNQTATSFKYGTNQDRYVIFTMAMSVDAYVPEPEAVMAAQTVNNVPVIGSVSSVSPGDELGMKINIYNKPMIPYRNRLTSLFFFFFIPPSSIFFSCCIAIQNPLVHRRSRIVYLTRYSPCLK